MLLCWIFVQDTPSFYGLNLLSDRNVHLLPRSDSLVYLLTLFRSRFTLPLFAD